MLVQAAFVHLIRSMHLYIGNTGLHFALCYLKTRLKLPHKIPNYRPQLRRNRLNQIPIKPVGRLIQ